MILGDAVQLGTMVSVIVVSSMILIALGVVYFAVSLFIIKAATSLVGFPNVSSETAVLSAAILSAASLIASNRK